MSRRRNFVYRIIQTVFLLWIMLTFLIFRLMPGSFEDVMMFRGADQETIEQFRDTWGLNDPLYVQYWRYVVNFVTLNPGVSLQYQIPVWEYVKIKMLNTFILAAPGVTLAYLIGSIIGTIFGTIRNSSLERYGLMPIIMVGSFPEFFTAILAIFIFASWLGWFPTGGMVGPEVIATQTAWWGRYFTADFATHYILPLFVVVVRFLFFPVLLMRTNVVEIMDQDFIFYDRLTGIPKINRYKHIAKHASLPVITLYPISLARAISGLVIIEFVFNWPGIGSALVNAVLARDIPVVTFIFFAAAAFVIISNFIIDTLYEFIDPRLAES